MITRGSKYSAVTLWIACLFVHCLLCNFILTLLQSSQLSACWNQDSYSGFVVFTALIQDVCWAWWEKTVASSFPPGHLFRIPLGVPLLFSLLNQNWHWQNLKENQNEFVLKIPAVSCHVYLVFSVILQLLRTSLSSKVINRVLKFWNPKVAIYVTKNFITSITFV